MQELTSLLDRLEACHGSPGRLPPRSALDWILWENAAYLVPEARRRQAYRALKQKTGLRVDGVLALPRQELEEIAALGGMHSGLRVEKLVTIAETVRDDFGGDLGSIAELPLTKARRALQRFPGIGRPGADKILLFTGTHVVPALDSNGMRVLVRLGLAAEGKSYATTHRSAISALEPHVERGRAWLIRAHDLLQEHGRQLCKNTRPQCDACPLADACPSAR